MRYLYQIGDGSVKVKSTRFTTYEYKGDLYRIAFRVVNMNDGFKLQVFGYRYDGTMKMMCIELDDYDNISTSKYDEIAYDFIKKYIGEEYEIL